MAPRDRKAAEDGASGSAWFKPKKRQGLRPESLRHGAHPRVVRVGQRYFPLTSSGASRCSVRITRLLPGGQRCQAQREDAGRRLVNCSVARLLTADEGGAGRHYRFVGYARRSYDTYALVVHVDQHWVRLILPEWQPSLLVSTAVGALPYALRSPGRWLSCRADLGAESAATVMPTRFGETGEGFRPELLPEPVVPRDDDEASRPRPASGPGCGDVVLFVSSDRAAGLRVRALDVYVGGHAPPVEPGGRAYIHDGLEVLGWRQVRKLVPLPNGTKLQFDGDWQPVSVAVELRRPAVGVVAGVRGLQEWTWRTWARAVEAE